jgi:hypothetical protein
MMYCGRPGGWSGGGIKSSRFFAFLSLLVCMLLARCLSVGFSFLFRAIAGRLHAVMKNKEINKYRSLIASFNRLGGPYPPLGRVLFL